MLCPELSGAIADQKRARSLCGFECVLRRRYRRQGRSSCPLEYGYKVLPDGIKRRACA